MNKKIFQFGSVILLSLFLAGCIDTNDQYTINPDGSGKVVHEATLTAVSFNSQPTTQGALKQAVKRILESTAGVDAWKDVTYKIQDDGKIYFKGTAYFPDINKLKIDNMGVNISTLSTVSFQTDGPDHIVLELKGSTDGRNESMGRQGPVPSSPEGIDQEIDKMKQQYEQQMKPMMTTVLNSLRIRKSFVLPGQVATSTNFTKNGDGSVGIDFEGAKLLQIMDTMINDRALMTKSIKEGKSPFDPNAANTDMMNEKLYGEAAPVRVEVAGPFQPLFDYSAEVAAAKDGYNKRESVQGILQHVPQASQGSLQGRSATVFLKSGKTVDGKILESTDKYTKIDFQGMPITYYADEIDKIVRD